MSGNNIAHYKLGTLVQCAINYEARPGVSVTNVCMVVKETPNMFFHGCLDPIQHIWTPWHPSTLNFTTPKSISFSVTCRKQLQGSCRFYSLTEHVYNLSLLFFLS